MQACDHAGRNKGMMDLMKMRSREIDWMMGHIVGYLERGRVET